MTSIVTREGKGSPLTNTEMDTNLTNLNTYKVEKTSDTGSAILPVGTTSERDISPQIGYDRFNTTINKKETWNGSTWVTSIDTNFRNILINPRISNGINQRNVANWAAVAIGTYGYDRWKKVDANTITQVVEDGNYTPSTVYTLAGNVTATQQITSPASGNWTIPAISNLETDIQLEEGYIASKKERRPKGLELSFCQRYFQNLQTLNVDYYASSVGVSGYQSIGFAVDFRATPTMGGVPTAAGGAANNTSQSFSVVTTRGCCFGVQAAAAGRVYFLAGAGANASAEL